MPAQIKTDAAIKALLKHEARLVGISGYVAQSDSKSTTVYPHLDTSLRYEIPTGAILQVEPGSEGRQLLFVSEEVEIRVTSTLASARAARELATTTFENFDQKANQMYNMLSSVMKTASEMRMAPIRSML